MSNTLPIRLPWRSHESDSDAGHPPRAVFVAGTFNDWNPTAAPMTRGADGEWCCEPGCETAYHGCPKCVPNSFGTMNRVIEVIGS